MLTKESILTDYECRILKMVCRGKTIRDISQSEFYSESAVRHHLSGVYHKLDVDNKNDAILKAREYALF